MIEVSPEQVKQEKLRNRKAYLRDLATPEVDVAHAYVHELRGKDAE